MFRQILARVQEEAEGVDAAVVLGYDGIAVEQVGTLASDEQTQLLFVELARLLHEMRQTAELLEVGAVQEVSLTCTERQFLFLPLSGEYFALLLLSSAACSGKARYLLKREALALRQALQ